MQRIKCLSRFLTIIIFLLCLPLSVFSATIDIMVVFDTTAKTWVDKNGGMNLLAVDAVARLNQATANSNVNLTFRLVHAAEVSYTHDTLSRDLSRLQAGTSGLSVVHSWRNTYGADVVVMLVDTGSASGTVGLGYLLNTYAGTPDYAYSVCAIRSVDISHTMTHEVGHNLGCHHSKDQKSDPGPNSYLNDYSAGWYFTGTNRIAYHTIMAYSNDGYGKTYVEAPLFSTPLESYQGTVAGDAADGDNSRNIRETMDIVAAYLPSTISEPDQFTFVDQTDVQLNTVVTSNGIIVSGLDATAIIYISGGTYSINSGTYTSAAGTVNNEDTVTVRLTSSGSYSTTKSATLTIGSVSDTFSVTTEAAPPDTTPDQFTFTDQTGVALNTVRASNTITVSGINTEAPISITGGTYSINGGAYTSDAGTVSNGDTVKIQLTSSGSYSTTTNATLTIGGVYDTFSVTTQDVPDTTPDQFTFTDRTGVALSAVITSNTIKVSGINTASPISITGGTYSINGGAYTSDADTVSNGDTVTIQLTSSESYLTTTDATLTIGGVSDSFSVTTQAATVVSGGGGGGGGCFIATAAFGSPLAGQVEILRKFRDRYLLTNAFGRKFVAWYYRVGPVAASYIKDKPLAKAAVRVALYPLIGFSLLLVHGIFLYLLPAGFVLLFVFRFRKSFVT